MNAYESARELVREAERIRSAQRETAELMARLLRGNLRHVSQSVLADLKKELRDFNIHTGKWK